MSKYIHSKYGPVLTCDICGKLGALYDSSLRRMKSDAAGQPQHLCDLCRPTAAWCEHHMAYHRRDDNHRRQCATCGGLFTSAVQQGLEHCPSCCRSMPPVVAPQPANAAPTLRAWVGRLLAQH